MVSMYAKISVALAAVLMCSTSGNTQLAGAPQPIASFSKQSAPAPTRTDHVGRTANMYPMEPNRTNNTLLQVQTEAREPALATVETVLQVVKYSITGINIGLKVTTALMKAVGTIIQIGHTAVRMLGFWRFGQISKNMMEYSKPVSETLQRLCTSLEKHLRDKVWSDQSESNREAAVLSAVCADGVMPPEEPRLDQKADAAVQFVLDTISSAAKQVTKRTTRLARADEDAVDSLVKEEVAKSGASHHMALFESMPDKESNHKLTNAEIRAQEVKQALVAFIRAYDASTGGARGSGRASLIQFFQKTRGHRITQQVLAKAGLIVRPAGFVQKRLNAAKARLAVRHIETNPILLSTGATKKLRKIFEGHGEFRESKRISYFEDDKRELDFYVGGSYDKLRTPSIEVEGWEATGKGSWTKRAIHDVVAKGKKFWTGVETYTVNQFAITIDMVTNLFAGIQLMAEDAQFSYPEFSRAGFAEALLEEAESGGVLNAPVTRLSQAYVDWCGDLATNEYEKKTKPVDHTSPFRRQLDLGNLNVQKLFEVQWEELFDDGFKETESLKKWVPDRVNLLPLFFESGRSIPSFDVLKYCKPAAASASLNHLQQQLSVLSPSESSVESALSSEAQGSLSESDAEAIREFGAETLRSAGEAMFQKGNDNADLVRMSQHLQFWEKRDGAYSDGADELTRAKLMVDSQIASVTKTYSAIKAATTSVKKGVEPVVNKVKKEIKEAIEKEVKKAAKDVTKDVLKSVQKNILEPAIMPVVHAVGPMARAMAQQAVYHVVTACPEAGIVAVQQMISQISALAADISAAVGTAVVAAPIVGDAIAIMQGLVDMVKNVISLISAIIDVISKATIEQKLTDALGYRLWRMLDDVVYRQCVMHETQRAGLVGLIRYLEKDLDTRPVSKGSPLVEGSEDDEHPIASGPLGQALRLIDAAMVKLRCHAAPPKEEDREALHLWPSMYSGTPLENGKFEQKSRFGDTGILGLIAPGSGLHSIPATLEASIADMSGKGSTAHDRVVDFIAFRDNDPRLDISVKALEQHAWEERSSTGPRGIGFGARLEGTSNAMRAASKTLHVPRSDQLSHSELTSDIRLGTIQVSKEGRMTAADHTKSTELGVALRDLGKGSIQGGGGQAQGLRPAITGLIGGDIPVYGAQGISMKLIKHLNLDNGNSNLERWVLGLLFDGMERTEVYMHPETEAMDLVGMQHDAWAKSAYAGIAQKGRSDLHLFQSQPEMRDTSVSGPVKSFSPSQRAYSRAQAVSVVNGLLQLKVWEEKSFEFSSKAVCLNDDYYMGIQGETQVFAPVGFSRAVTRSKDKRLRPDKENYAAFSQALVALHASGPPVSDVSIKSYRAPLTPEELDSLNKPLEDYYYRVNKGGKRVYSIALKSPSAAKKANMFESGSHSETNRAYEPKSGQEDGLIEVRTGSDALTSFLHVTKDYSVPRATLRDVEAAMHGASRLTAGWCGESGPDDAIEYCSGHGQCIFRDAATLPLDVAEASSALGKLRAVCECEQGYAGQFCESKVQARPVLFDNIDPDATLRDAVKRVLDKEFWLAGELDGSSRDSYSFYRGMAAFLALQGATPYVSDVQTGRVRSDLQTAGNAGMTRPLAFAAEEARNIALEDLWKLGDRVCFPTFNDKPDPEVDLNQLRKAAFQTAITMAGNGAAKFTDKPDVALELASLALEKQEQLTRKAAAILRSIAVRTIRIETGVASQFWDKCMPKWIGVPADEVQAQQSQQTDSIEESSTSSKISMRPQQAAFAGLVHAVRHLTKLISDAKENGMISNVRALTRLAHVVMGETDLKLLDEQLKAAFDDGQFNEWLSSAGPHFDTKALDAAGQRSLQARGRVETKPRSEAKNSNLPPLHEGNDLSSSVDSTIDKDVIDTNEPLLLQLQHGRTGMRANRGRTLRGARASSGNGKLRHPINRTVDALKLYILELSLASTGNMEGTRQDLHDGISASLSHALATPSARIGDLVAMALAFRTSPYLIQTMDGEMSTAGPATLISAVTGLTDAESLSEFMKRYLPNKDPSEEGGIDRRTRLQSHPLVVVASTSSESPEIGFEFVLDRSTTVEAAHADSVTHPPKKWQESRRSVVTLTTELAVLDLMQDSGLMNEDVRHAVACSLGDIKALYKAFEERGGAEEGMGAASLSPSEVMPLFHGKKAASGVHVILQKKVPL